jgi:nitrate/nitrite transport system substrate-binding protein
MTPTPESLAPRPAGDSDAADLSPRLATDLPTVRLGYIPLTDCAPLAVAAEFGFGARHGIRLEVRAEPSWAALRDRLLCGEIDAAHCLYGLVYDVELGLLGVEREMAILMTLNRNGQAITVDNRLCEQGVRDGETLARWIRRAPPTTWAHTFPTGTHALWLYYWLAAHGIHPLEQVRTLTVPPPRMVARLGAGAMQGFSAGEPWSALGVSTGIGFTIATSQSIWPDHPEKVLACTRQFAHRHPDTARALVMTLLEAARYADDPANHEEVARLLVNCGHVDAPVDQVLPRLQGHYHDGLGRRWHDAHALTFHADGAVNYPYVSDGLWFMSQFHRWGLLPDDVDWEATVRAVNQTELYAEAAGALGIAVPATPMRSSVLMDGVRWDGQQARAVAERFAVHGRAAVPGDIAPG